MSERPQDPGMTSGDPLGPGPGGDRAEPAAPPRPAPEPFAGGYSSPPPPGAFAPAAPAATQAPVAGRYVLAGWGSRVGAQLIDGLIIMVGALIVVAIFGAIFSVGFLGSEETGIAAVAVGLVLGVLAVTIVSLVYAPLMMARTNGKTLGRMATGIRVVRANGRPITFGFGMLREVAVKALLFGVAGSFTVGLANLLDWLWPLWDDENRALHDFIVDTRTVKD